MSKKMLVRETKRLALIRMEEAARTERDFEEVQKKWDTREETAERKGRRYGFYTNSEIMDWLLKQRTRYNYLDIIFCNEEDFPVLIEDVDIYKLVAAIRPKPKDILYLSSIRLQSIQQIAAIKEQSDRNILKMKTKMIDKLQTDLSERLILRICTNGVITTSQRKFIEEYLLKEYLESKSKKEKANAT